MLYRRRVSPVSIHWWTLSLFPLRLHSHQGGFPLPKYRLAIRRTQRDVDVQKAAPAPDRRELQRLAKEAGIPANQSTEALVKALGK